MGERSFQQRIALRSLTADPVREIEAVVTCTLIERGEQHECRVALAAEGLALESGGPDFFEALCGVRERLAALDLAPLCFGASRNVFPSRVTRERSAGLHAYRLELGRRGRREDRVEIFATGEGVEPVSVAEQQAFFARWLASLAQPGR